MRFKILFSIVLLIGTSALALGCGDEDGGGPQIFTVADTSTDTNSPDLTAHDIQDEQTPDTTTSIDTSVLTDQTDPPDDGGCIPQTCEDRGYECGATNDGCGQPLNCGTCGTDLLCQSGQCVPDCDAVCCPTTCEIEGALCGEIPNGCGNSLDCGSCPQDFVCNALRQCQPAPDPVCGNGFVERDEECDNGSGNSNVRPNACRRDCTLPRCGDGVKDTPDACEDGNTIDTDACTAACTLPPHCARCSNDTTCGPSNRCSAALGNACLVACDLALGSAACPLGYTCETDASLGGDFCTPNAGACLEICDNSVDDDGDGLVDCADDACDIETFCEPTEVTCDDGIDNDGDGDLDCEDNTCALTTLCLCPGVTCNAPPNPACTTDKFTTYTLPGRCEAVGGLPTCIYTETDTICDTPGATSCGSGGDSIVSFPDGADDCRVTGSTAECTYAQTTTTCNVPPPATCNGNDARLVYQDGPSNCASTGPGQFGCVYTSSVQQCNAPPPAICSTTDEVLAYLDNSSNCQTLGGIAQCVYQTTLTPCSTPPAAACGAGNDSVVTFLNDGNNCAIVSGVAQCNYPQTVTQCNAAPAPTCNGNDAVISYADNASNCAVVAGVPSCTYPPTTTPCNTPPAAICNGDAVRSFTDNASNCSAGACVYTPADAFCNSPPPVACAAGNDAIVTSINTANDCQIVGSTPQCVYQNTRVECDSPPAGGTCGADNDSITGSIDGPSNCVGGTSPTCQYSTGTAACDFPPSPTCNGDSIRTFSDGPSNCSGSAGSAQCTYAFTDAACNTPPAAQCDGTDAVRTFTNGATDCSTASGSPQCSYASTVAPCATPPAAICSGDAVRTFNDSGNDCAGGTCTYGFTDAPCVTPPAATCNGDSIRTFLNGSSDCSTASGSPQCSYAPSDAACNTPPPAVCTAANDGFITSANGATDCQVLGGIPSCVYATSTTMCDTPPAPSCSGNTLTTRNSVGTCSISGGAGSCTYGTTTTDCASQGKVCGTDAGGVAACITPPATITSVNYPVIARGGKLIITGTGFTGATAVTIGGISQTFTVNSATQITINALPDSVPLDNQPLVITTPAGPTAGFTVTVINLVINELDSDNSGNSENSEYIEIKTGLNRQVNLTGYRVVGVDGDNNEIYTFDNQALGNTSASSPYLYLVGGPSVSGRQLDLGGDEIYQNSGDAVIIFQALNSISSGTAYSTVAASNNVIDVLVHDTNDNDNTSLLNTIYGGAASSKKVQINEGNDNNSNSISRCNSQSGQYTIDDRLDGRVFKSTSNKTPGAANNCN